MARTALDPVLLTSSVGGHFNELEFVVDALEIPRAERHWVLPRHIQTDERLAREQVTWSPLVQSGEYVKAARNLGFAVALHRRLRPRLVVSTGAAQSTPHLVAAALLRTPILYVESVARMDSPSVTGRLAALLPKARLLAPQPGWPAPWEHGLDAFSAFEVTAGHADLPLRRAMVALGSEHFPFPRAVDAIVRAVPTGVEVTWQVGETLGSDGADRNRWLTAKQMTASMRSADVVITHGGAGSILTALDAGQVPVVLPRHAAHGEHVDDHQVRMVQSLAARGLVVAVPDPAQLSVDHLRRAATLAVTRRSRPALVPVPAAMSHVA
ncbi:glycosyltransferase [Nocardioides nitrophenolicus]|uniref:glycosyltransferase n=1 Tax=Nocardioides nitrophenolicus TaxID=60489 RepID=UPI00195A46E1|nr:glycosyltransferase [Nocardioides nitrophenolicus]MBM7520298.1 UDP-N-acetylglucosamine transferase subunit ALG13 [Nocardioides nitrophenolicus]